MNFINLILKIKTKTTNKQPRYRKQRDVKTRAHLKRALKLQAVNSRKKMELEEIKKLWIEEMIEVAFELIDNPSAFEATSVL